MDHSTYQVLAERTECDQKKSLKRYIELNGDDAQLHRMNHSALGLMGEAGEIASALEKAIYYGQELDVVNLEEEIGDCLWRLAQLANALKVSLGDLMDRNIEKLKIRYPDKFDEDLAREENRDREKEREAIEEDSDGCETLHLANATSLRKDEWLQLKQEREEAIFEQGPVCREARDHLERTHDACLSTGCCDGAKPEGCFSTAGTRQAYDVEIRRMTRENNCLCGFCGGLLNDEMIRQMMLGNIEVGGCSNCDSEVVIKDFRVCPR